MKIALISLLLLMLTSCDAYIQLHYIVENKTDTEISIHIPNFKPQNQLSYKSFDTTIVIPYGESVWVGSSMHDIDFPWATKNIYKKNPGVCDMEIQYEDSVQTIPCDLKSWKYKKRTSIYIIK